MSDENQFDPKKFGEEVRDRAKKFSEDLHDHIHREINEKINGKRKPVVIGIHLGKSCEGNWGIFTGVLIGLIGVVILLDNLNIVAAGQLYRFWPLILVAFGLMNFFGRGSRIWGAILVGFGLLLQLDRLAIIHLTWGMIWGLVLIAVGAAVLWGSLVAQRLRLPLPDPNADPSVLSDNVVFGGIERRITTKDFRGGVATAIFGGIELDLSEADMQQNEARLEVNAIFGGIELRVPYHWHVVARGTPIFGGFVDKTRLRNAGDSNDPQQKTLVLTGSAIFGGVDVKN